MEDRLDLNIGHVTAYAYAKSKGYTGTEEQFAIELAQFAQNAQKVAEDRAAVEALVDEFLNTTVPSAVQSVTNEGTRQIELVGDVGTTQIGLVQDEGTTQVGNVNNAGTDQVSAVNQAGQTQVEYVTNEGTTQVDRVQTKGDEVIGSIPQDYTDLVEDVADLSRQLNDETTGLDSKAPVILETASGAIASFSDGADNMPVKKLVAQIEPVQEGTGVPSPDNVRPISGWTGANIFATEKNMMECTSDNMIGKGVTVDNGVLTTSFHTVTEAGIVFPVKPNTRYIVGFTKLSGGPMYVRCAEYSKKPTSYGSDQIREIIHSENTVESDAKNTITTGPNAQYVFYGFYRSYDANEQSVDKWFANLESAGNAYEPYTGNQIPVNWQTEAGTIYSGTVTLNEDGSADIISTYKRISLGSLSWTKSGSRFESGRISDARSPTNILTCLCDVYNAIPNVSSPGAGEICFNPAGSYPYLRVVDANYSTAADFKAAMENHYIIYLLTSSYFTEVHLDNIGRLYTFLGTNNVWIDTGAITECDYPADTKLYIDGLTAPDEDMIANANIASGKYFVVNNQLYLSTAAIAAGASIVPGTNCTATNLAEALNALNT